jgi:hypothetical protein
MPIPKTRITGIALGVIGLFFLSYILIGFLFGPLGFDIRQYELYERWEIALISQSAVVLASSITLGITGLLFSNEHKSPYLLGASTLLAILSLVLLSQAVTPKWISSNTYRSGTPFWFISIPLMLLLASTLLIAYSNIWKSKK